MYKSIALIGMPASGKTSIGKMLSGKLNKTFIDTDELVETVSGESIPDMFKVGEAYFRDFETKVCEMLADRTDLIISTGGGIILREKNIELLKKNSLIVFLDRSLDEIIKSPHDARPLLKDGEEAVRKLYNNRINLYHKYADITVINDKSISDMVEEIIKEIVRK